MYYNGSRMLMGLCGSLFFLLVLAALVLFIIWAARAWSRSGGSAGSSFTRQPSSGDRALDILRERYARGEITKDQYDQMRHDLTG